MRHRTPRARGQPLRAVCPRNVVRLFRLLGRPTVRPADRSPRPREAEGRLTPEMAESHEARSQAQAQRRAWPQCIATWAASGVAVPLAFFCTLFFRHRKKSVSAPWGGSPTTRAVVGASILRRGSRIMRQSGAFHAPDPLGAASPLTRRSRRVNPRPGQRVCVCGRTKGLFARLFGNLRAPKLERDSWELHFWLSRKKQPPFFSPPFPPHTQPFVFPLHEPQKLFIINPF